MDETLPDDIWFTILGYVEPQKAMYVCSRWRELIKARQRMEYIKAIVAFSGESRSFVSDCYDDYINNWCCDHAALG
jgi:hypothetical protein